MTFLDFFDLLGTAAFAVSGALVGIRKKLDVFGVTILALTTAVGGGIIRDVVIANTPPLAFRNFSYVLISLITAVAVMMLHRHIKRFQKMIQICDAIGLGVFAAGGANMAVEFGYYNLVTVTFLAVVTAVGGGVIRDIFAQQIPMAFCREIYATAALLGAICFYMVYPLMSPPEAMYLCCLVTTGTRLFAIEYQLDLPRAK